MLQGVQDTAKINPALRPQPWKDALRGPAENYGTNGQRTLATLPKLN